MAHEPSAAQHGCRLDLAPRGAPSASSRCSWRAAVAPGPKSQTADPGPLRPVRGRKAKALPSPRCEQPWLTHGSRRGSSAVPGPSLLQDEPPSSQSPPHPLAMQDAQHSPGPATALAASQPAALQAHHEVYTRQHFPTEKIRQGKKNRRQKPQEKPHSAFPRALTQLSRQPCGMEKAVPAPHGPPSAEWDKATGGQGPLPVSPSPEPAGTAQLGQAGRDLLGGPIQISFIQTIN